MMPVRPLRANVVAPGYIKTQLTEVIPEEAKTKMLGLTPLGRLGDPEDVAGGSEPSPATIPVETRTVPPAWPG